MGTRRHGSRHIATHQENTMARTLFTAASLAALTLAAAGAAHAATTATVVIQSGMPHYQVQSTYPLPPPPPRYERVPPPRRGMVWSQGHWEWHGNRHVWVPGQWVRVRQGYHYRQPHWEQRGNQWHYARGGWDRDGDGVPNRYDRRPDNPYRR